MTSWKPMETSKSRDTLRCRGLPGWTAPEDEPSAWTQQARENPVYTARSVRLAVDAQGGLMDVEICGRATRET